MRGSHGAVAGSVRRCIVWIPISSLLSSGRYAICQQIPIMDDTSPSQESHEFRHDLIPRFIHQPVARALYADPLDVVGDQAALSDQEFTGGLFSSEYQHRHCQFGSGKDGEVLGILFESAEHLEACSHAAWLRVSRRVNLTICFGNGPCRVGGEVIPEVLEVDPFSAID